MYHFLLRKRRLVDTYLKDNCQSNLFLLEPKRKEKLQKKSGTYFTKLFIFKVNFECTS